MPRIIFHIDVNSAFLSWSAVKRLREDPDAVDLRLIPSAVGGDVQTRHGVITAKSIPAKKYGVTTGEPVVSALKKCPGLVLVPSDFKTYREYSRKFIEILKKYASEVEKVSIDEAFLDMTDSAKHFKEQIDAGQPYPYCAAEHIKNEIRDTLGFTVNVGISTNKILAKCASDFTKPDRIHTLYPEEIAEKLWPLPVGELFGCGKKTAEKLRTMGINTIGELAQTDLSLLKSILGSKSAEYLHNNANGISDSPVRSVREQAKSYSNETTTGEDISAANYEAIALPILHRLAEKVASRLTKDNVRANTVFVIVKTGEFQRHTRQTRLSSSTNSAAVITKAAEDLMSALLTGPDGLFAAGQVLRLLGVGCSGIDDSPYTQLDLFTWAEEKQAEDARREEALRETEERRQEEIRRKKVRREAEIRAKEKAAEDLRVKEEKQRRLDEMLSAVQKKYGEKSLRKGEK
ncbi:MAG: DNA polymerase IV [Lachnospiraceae bacterium]|nr:DNA polymerase IV [Lachnospiraceae bacterium]